MKKQEGKEDEKSGSDENEPDWIKLEKENFKTLRDLNKDNVMDRDEIADWILPVEYDHSLSEAKHLIHEADENKVATISKL